MENSLGHQRGKCLERNCRNCNKLVERREKNKRNEMEIKKKVVNGQRVKD